MTGHIGRDSLGDLLSTAASEADTPVEDPLLRAAQRAFGISYLKPIQRLVLSNTLEGYLNPQERTPYQIIILPTGTGKSLCFQLPTLFLEGLTLIVYPLLGLIADQYRRLKDLSIGVAAITGSTAPQERQRVLRQARQGKIKMILTNPETVVQPKILSQLRECCCDHLVIDEAHCIYEWGESFRPTYARLGEIVEANIFKMVSAFTATASSEILQRVQRRLFGNRAVHLVATDPDRSNIHYHVVATGCLSRLVIQLCQVAEAPAPDLWRPEAALPRPALIFCRSRVAAMHYAHQLRRMQGREYIRFYHAGLSKEERATIEQWFLKSRQGILCATCAYGMGMDKPDIRAVLHTEMPDSIESYLQESGRAGRDGQPAMALLVSPLRPIAARNSPESPLQRQRIQAMAHYVYQNQECRRKLLTAYLGTGIEQCSGCDICNGSYQRVSPESYRLIHWLWRHKRRYRKNEIAEALRGSVLCRGWMREHIDDMCNNIQQQHIIKIAQRGIFRGRINMSPRYYREIRDAYRHSRE